MQEAVTDQKNWINKGSVKAVARYAMLPGIFPRIRALGFHFGHFAYLLALVFSSARLIPMTHPILNYTNIGKYGVRQVIAMAANNLTWSWKNTDQIAIFSAIVIGMIMIMIQAALICFYALLGGEAQAAGTTSFFTTPTANIHTDVVLIFLEQVFGANLDIFGAANAPLGTPVYLGLQAILGFYSMATMVIAVIIVLYYILTVVGEAAKTGTPFGQRFNSLWAPIRLVVALGLLVPLSTGLNSAQYLTLTIAKMGSGLATGMWTEFASTITGATDIVAKPAGQSTTGLVSRIFLSEVCAAAFNQIEERGGRKITLLQNLRSTSKVPTFSAPQSMIDSAKNANMGYVGITWSRNKVNTPANDHTCGHIIIDLAEFDFYSDQGIINAEEGFWEKLFGGRDLTNKIGEIHNDIKTTYISEIGKVADRVRPAAKAIAAYRISINPTPALGNKGTLDAANIMNDLRGAAVEMHTNIDAKIIASYQSITNSDMSKSQAYDKMIKGGWGAAGLWYGNLTKINQKYMEAVSAAAPTLGTVIYAPAIENAGQGVHGSFGFTFGVFNHGLLGAGLSELESSILLAQQDYVDIILSSIPADSPLYSDAKLSDHSEGDKTIAKALVWVLGGGDLYNLKNNPTQDPMSRIAGAGHAMLTRSMLAFGAGSISAIIGSGAKIVSKGASKIPIVSAIPAAIATGISEFAGALAGLFFAFAGIALVAGVFLAYVIPLLPFIYFVFAIIGWILEIFEAVIAMPLWALAHLRIDGDGMPGQAAIGGYQLLLMILLRPALIVIGLIGGYVIFGAAMYFFSTLFNSAAAITQKEIVGSSTGSIGILIYTLIFAFLTYNIAIMCFKMIDDVPKGIMRWMGASVQPFSDSRGDPISGTREVVIGAVAGGAAIKGGISSMNQKLQQNKMTKQSMKESAMSSNRQDARAQGIMDAINNKKP